MIVNKYVFLNKKRRVNVFFNPSSKRSQSVPESNKRTLCSNLNKKNVWRKQGEEVKRKGRGDKKGKERGKAEEAIQSERTGSYVALLVLR